MNIFKRKSACSIGIIKSVDGPTAIFKSKKRKRKQLAQEAIKQKEFIDFAATQVAANFRPFSEIESFLVEKYNAAPYVLSESELCTLKSNVIINNFKDVLNLPTPLPPNPTKRQLLNYVENDTSFQQARDYPAEKLGLVMKAFKILDEAKNPIIVQLEMTTEYMIVNGTNEEISNDIFLWQGVTQNDIDNKTLRFISYVTTLQNLGKLTF